MSSAVARILPNFFCAKILISHANLLYAFIHDARKNTCFSVSTMFQFEVFHQFVVLFIRLFLPTITVWKGCVSAAIMLLNIGAGREIMI